MGRNHEQKHRFLSICLYRHRNKTEREENKMAKNKGKDPLSSTFLEKVMYGVGDAGGTMILTFPGSYLTLYYTDSVGMAVAFVGTMLLVCRLLDGLSDILMGVLIDRTHTRWGKARPWFALSVIPLALSFVALFMMPKSLTVAGQRIYAYVTYFLVTVVFYTINNVSYHAMLQRFSLTAKDRGTVSAVRSFLCVRHPPPYRRSDTLSAVHLLRVLWNREHRRNTPLPTTAGSASQTDDDPPHSRAEESPGARGRPSRNEGSIRSPLP